jgi:hypothetical protein
VSRRALTAIQPRHDRCTWGAAEAEDGPCAEPEAVVRTWHNPHVPGGVVQVRAYCARHGAWVRQLEGHLPMTERAVSR